MKTSYTLRLPEELRKKIKERIKQAPSREEALRLLDAIVPDVPPLSEDKMHTTNR